MTEAQRKIVEAYRASGRPVFYYPRKKLISMSGHKAIPVKEAVAQMWECLKRELSA